jgi:hypothetical protein
MKLIDKLTNRELRLNQKVKTFRGDIVTLVDWKEPYDIDNDPYSGARVYVKFDSGSRDEFYPSVINAIWVK